MPSIEEILDVDREYREKAKAGQLVKIAPRRFNPSHVAWLPVLHTTRGRRHYPALFSNTALAHRLARTDDWVIIYWDDGRGERQGTVVTAAHGPLKGRRIVRGREAESEQSPVVKDAVGSSASARGATVVNSQIPPLWRLAMNPPTAAQ